MIKKNVDNTFFFNYRDLKKMNIVILLGGRRKSQVDKNVIVHPTIYKPY